MSNNSHNTLSNALDVLVNGPRDPSSNIIPSAPADIANNDYIPLFNPAALTIDIPAVSGVTTAQSETTQEEREVNHQQNEELFQDEETSDMDSDSDYDRAVMPPPSQRVTQRLIRAINARAASHHINQTVSHAIEEANTSEPGRSTSNTQNAETRECGICYNQITIDKIVNTRCNHQFCNACFFRWMRGNVTCPMCREDFTSWRNHSRDNINNDIIAVTEMFNSTLREHVHLNRLNTNVLKSIAELKKEKALIQNSLVSTRKLIDYNRGYAIGLSSIKNPEPTGNKTYDKGLNDGFAEFGSVVRKQKYKKSYRSLGKKNRTNDNNQAFRFKLNQPIFQFKGFNP